MYVPSVSLGADRRAARTRPVAWPMARPVAPPERPGSRLVQGFRARCGRRCCCRAGRAVRGQGGMRWTRARRGHSGHAGCAVRRCGVYSSDRAGCRGAGGAATSSCMPLIVQPQSERGVCAGTSTRMKSWPLCLHARGTHAMNTQICALLSLLVTAERASTGVSVHQCNQAQVSWISKQPGIDGRYGARAAYRQGLVTRHRLGHARWRPGLGFGPHIAQRWPFCWPARPARRQWRNLLSEAHKERSTHLVLHGGRGP